MAKPGRSLPEVRNNLPDEIKPAFDDLVEDYQASAIERVGWGQPSYIILADLIRKGWRKETNP